jgi:hypothetical protein
LFYGDFAKKKTLSGKLSGQPTDFLQGQVVFWMMALSLQIVPYKKSLANNIRRFFLILCILGPNRSYTNSDW